MSTLLASQSQILRISLGLTSAIALTMGVNTRTLAQTLISDPIDPAQLTTQPTQNFVGITTHWQNPTGAIATDLHYGLNAFQAFDPKVAGLNGNATYQNNLATMRPGILRYHNMRSLRDSTQDASGWVINPTTADYRWDRAKIALAMQGRRLSPKLMMNIPGWISYMTDAQGRLKPEHYEQFAEFCADLVRVVNIELKEDVKYWDVINEKDNAYPNDMAELGRIYTLAARAMKRVDPTIKVGGPSFISPYDTLKVSAFLSTAHADLDFVSYHTYSIGREATPVSRIWQSASTLGTATQAMRRALRAFPARSIELFHSEYNISYTPPDARMTNMISAIYDALAMASITSAGATGAMAWNEADGWYGKMNNHWGNWQKRPAAFVHQLYNRYMLGNVVHSTSSNAASVTSYAVRNGNQYSLALINRSEQDVWVQNQFTGLNVPLGTVMTAFQVDTNGLTTTQVSLQTLQSGYRMPANTVHILTMNP